MRKWLASLLATILIFGVVGCGVSSGDGKNDAAELILILLAMVQDCQWLSMGASYHNAEIEYANQVGKGTSIKLIFPKTNRDSEA